MYFIQAFFLHEGALKIPTDCSSCGSTWRHPKKTVTTTPTLIESRLLAETRASGGSSPGSEEAFESDGRRVLGVLARLAASVPPEVAQPLAHKLLEMLLDLVARPETSAALVAALHMLCFAQVCPHALMSSCPRWWTLFLWRVFGTKMWHHAVPCLHYIMSGCGERRLEIEEGKGRAQVERGWCLRCRYYAA